MKGSRKAEAATSVNQHQHLEAEGTTPTDEPADECSVKDTMMDTSTTGASLNKTAVGGDVAIFTVEPKIIEESYPPIFMNNSKEFELIDDIPQELITVDKTVEEMFLISRVFIPITNAQEPRLCFQQELRRTDDEEGDEEAQETLSNDTESCTTREETKRIKEVTDEMTDASSVNSEELWESINLNNSSELVPEEPAEDSEQQPATKTLKYTNVAKEIKREPYSSGDLYEENSDDPQITTEAFASLFEKQELTWFPEERLVEKACKEMDEEDYKNVSNTKVSQEGVISGVTDDFMVVPDSRQKGKVIPAPLEEPTDISGLMTEVLITEGLKEPFTFSGKIKIELIQDVFTDESAEGVTQTGPKRVEKSEPCLSINIAAVEPETSTSVCSENPETSAQQLA